MKPIKLKKGRVPRKLKKKWKKDPYFSLFGGLWIRDYKMNVVQKEIMKYWGLPKVEINLSENITIDALRIQQKIERIISVDPYSHIASVRDTGESI